MQLLIFLKKKKKKKKTKQNLQLLISQKHKKISKSCKLVYRSCSCVEWLYYFFTQGKHSLNMWGSKIWAHDLGPGTTFYQQYARGEEITKDRCN